MSGGYTVSFERDRLDLDVIHGFLRTAYWSVDVPRETVERSVRNSLCVGVYAAGGAQAGFARAVTDYAAFAWISDVFVLPEHRGQGLARTMVQALLDHPEVAGLRRWMLATVDAHGVYQRIGFTELDDPTRYLMYRPGG